MENKKGFDVIENKSKLDVWMISRISAFLESGIGQSMDDLFVWYVEHKRGQSQIVLDFTKKELGFINWSGDDKTYYSLVGVAMMAEFTTEDYMNEKK